jgi:hypothetical protein
MVEHLYNPIYSGKEDRRKERKEGEREEHRRKRKKEKKKMREERQGKEQREPCWEKVGCALWTGLHCTSWSGHPHFSHYRSCPGRDTLTQNNHNTSETLGAFIQFMSLSLRLAED